MNGSSALKSILLLAANPKGTEGLRLQEEEREIKERLRLAGYGKTPINSTGATRTKDIQQAMLDFNPQIVHFSGHGAEQDGLVFEDVTGKANLVSSNALAGLFRLFSKRVECVVLNACGTKPQAEAIAQYVNYVVGMSRELGDRAAIDFAIGFYSALGAGESIEFAYELGCNAIQLGGIEEHLTPVLYKKGELLQFHPSNREPQKDEISPPDVITTATILSGKDEVIVDLMNKLFDALCSPNVELGIQKFEEIAHKSLFQNGQIDPAFHKNNFNVSFTRPKLYKRPVEIISHSTKRTRLGLRADKEDGEEEIYAIARNDKSGGLDGYIRIFFPANGGVPKISGFSL
ncbi:CHAT domain-containing protein [Nostoc sp. LEGE 12450]|uniref:CHAT domain-containing protein n=1 Tax=Nostoc sp. LEGE 12450 TaxID=1828643 RepID=UPI001882C8D2|nr:CHAT domain-containing protein [Nostoc sp. LEGE 12450]MBE8990049.1 CHAT domain-containing protein [Nostoc sp. LEGE 12450]